MKDDLFLPKDEDFEHLFQRLVSKALQELFEEKLLYQSVTLDLTPINQEISRIKMSLPSDEEMMRGKFQAYRDKIISSPWNFFSEFNSRSGKRAVLREQVIPWEKDISEAEKPLFSFLIPTIRVACKFCKDALTAHNSGFPGDKVLYTNFSKKSEGKICEVFTFPFECQACKKEPLFYLVRRDNLKFTITGRSHFPKIEIQKSLPEEEASYFRDAIIGYKRVRPWLRCFSFASSSSSICAELPTKRERLLATSLPTNILRCCRLTSLKGSIL